MKLMARLLRSFFESRFKSVIVLAPGLLLLGYTWLNYRLPTDRAEVQKAEELAQASEIALRSSMEILLPTLLSVHHAPANLTPNFWNQIRARIEVQINGPEAAIQGFLRKYRFSAGGDAIAAVLEPGMKADGPLRDEISKLERSFAGKIAQTEKQRRDFGSGIRKTSPYDQRLSSLKFHLRAGRSTLRELNAKVVALTQARQALEKWTVDKKRELDRTESLTETLLLLGTTLSLLITALQQIALRTQPNLSPSAVK